MSVRNPFELPGFAPSAARALSNPVVYYGHREDALKEATKVQEFFYPEPVTPSGGSYFLPQYKVATFRVGVGVKVAGSVQFPGEFYHTRGEAQNACTERVREALKAIADRLVGELTNAALGQGLNADPELDVTDALRQYLKAVKT